MRCTVVIIMLTLCAWVQAQEAQARPHIILITLDGLRADVLSCMAHPVVQTPHLDQLAREGVLFEQAFSVSPARARSQQVMFFGQAPAAQPLPFPPLLLNYETIFLGQQQLSDATTLPFRQAFSRWLGAPQSDVLLELLTHTFPSASATSDPEALLHDALEHLLSTASRPFSISIALPLSFFSPIAAHQEIRYRDQQANLPVPLTYLNPTEQSAARLPNDLFSGQLTQQALVAGTNHLRAELLSYYQSVSRCDDFIGHLRQTLMRAGLADNTIIIVTSTCGTLLGEHGLQAVESLYDPSVHVPCIVFDPSQPSNRRGWREQRLISTSDIAPTMLDAAGITTKNHRTGASLLPLLHGRSVPWRNYLLSSHQAQQPDDFPSCYSLRNGDWTYIRYVSEATGANKVRYEELFHTSIDPHQQRNLIDDPHYTAIKTTLQNEMDKQFSESDRQ